MAWPTDDQVLDAVAVEDGDDAGEVRGTGSFGDRWDTLKPDAPPSVPTSLDRGWHTSPRSSWATWSYGHTRAEVAQAGGFSSSGRDTSRPRRPMGKRVRFPNTSSQKRAPSNRDVWSGS